MGSLFCSPPWMTGLPRLPWRRGGGRLCSLLAHSRSVRCGGDRGHVRVCNLGRGAERDPPPQCLACVTSAPYFLARRKCCHPGPMPGLRGSTSLRSTRLPTGAAGLQRDGAPYGAFPPRLGQMCLQLSWTNSYTPCKDPSVCCPLRICGSQPTLHLELCLY